MIRVAAKGELLNHQVVWIEGTSSGRCVLEITKRSLAGKDHRDITFEITDEDPDTSQDGFRI